jgi:hypothetical protein
MKATTSHTAEFKGSRFIFVFQYWPSHPGDRENPPEPAELHIISMVKDDGTNIALPDGDLQPMEYAEIETFLLDEIAKHWDHPEA